MARINNEAIFGKVGNLVFYTMNGKNYVRTKPTKRKKKRNQPDNPETTAFSTISRYGSPMLTQIKRQLTCPVKIGDYNRVRGFMLTQYKAYSQAANWPLVAFTNGIATLNETVDIRDCMPANIVASDTGNGQIELQFAPVNPVKQIKAPAYTSSLCIKIVAVASSFNQPPGITDTTVELYPIDYTNTNLPAKTIVLHTKAATGDIVLLSLAIEYTLQKQNMVQLCTDANWLPAAVISMGRLS